MPAVHRLASVGVVAVAVVLAACSAGDEAPPASPTTTEADADPAPTAPSARVIEISVEDGAVVGGAQRKSVDLGETVRLVVTSDVTDEVHVHGYDLLADVGPTAPAEIEFAADIPGVFEVELESAGVEILQLEVR